MHNKPDLGTDISAHTMKPGWLHSLFISTVTLFFLQSQHLPIVNELRLSEANKNAVFNGVPFYADTYEQSAWEDHSYV